MDFGTTFVKYVLFIFNTIVSIIGILGIIQGVLVIQTFINTNPQGNSGDVMGMMGVGIIVISSIVVFISFLGCCGAIRESVCLTMCYAVCMLILLIIQISAITFYWVNKEDFQEAIGKFVDSAWESRKAGSFEVIETALKCCGKNGVTDYIASLSLPPNSCCEHHYCSPPYLNAYGGCRSKLQLFAQNSTDLTNTVGLALVVVELIGFIFAYCLANNIRNDKRRNNY